MDTFNLDKDITVFCVTAKSFPDGIQEAHDKLHNLVEYSPHRKYFGISWYDKNRNIIYKAAAEEYYQGEFSKHHLETFTIRKGTYICIDVKNFMQHTPAIGESFTQLKMNPHIDPRGAAVEWYLNDTDCRCMIRLKENENES